MAEPLPPCMAPTLMEQLHALAERRCAHLIEMQMSGRWQKYYSYDEFISQIRAATDSAKAWQAMADRARSAYMSAAAGTVASADDRVAA